MSVFLSNSLPEKQIFPTIPTIPLMRIHIPDVVQSQFVFEVTGPHSDIHSLFSF